MMYSLFSLRRGLLRMSHAFIKTSAVLQSSSVITTKIILRRKALSAH